MRELLLLSVANARFGVWKDSIRAVGEARGLHRLPFASSVLAGMAIIEGRLQSLADLAACIGYPPAARAEPAHLLLMPEGDGIAGFVLQETPESVMAPERSVRALPSCLATPLIDSCVVLDAAPIPIIDLGALCGRLRQGIEEPPMPGCSTAAAPSLDISAAAEAALLFAAGGELYATDARDVAGEPVPVGPISPLPGSPLFLRGIACFGETIIPVVDFPLHVRREPNAPMPPLLIVATEPERMGVLVDEYAGSIGVRGAERVAELPSFLRRSWMRAAICREGRIVPLIELGRLLSREPAPEAAADSDRAHVSDPDLADRFGSADIEVVEFVSNGVCHALPRREVETTAPLLPCRWIPSAADIVMGVAEWDSELLPVVDIGTLSGARSPATRGKGMVVVNNGDFRALLLCEEVLAEKTVAKGLLRPVPVTLPHRVVYGCYTDAQAVRLILNLRALVLYHEGSPAASLLPELASWAGWAGSTVAASAPPRTSAAPASPLSPTAPSSPLSPTAPASPRSPAAPSSPLSPAAPSSPLSLAAARHVDVPSSTGSTGTPVEEHPTEAGSAAHPPSPTFPREPPASFDEHQTAAAGRQATAAVDATASRRSTTTPGEKRQFGAAAPPTVEETAEPIPPAPATIPPAEGRSAVSAERPPRGARKRGRGIAIGVIAAGLAVALYLVLRPVAPMEARTPTEQPAHLEPAPAAAPVMTEPAPAAAPVLTEPAAAATVTPTEQTPVPTPTPTHRTEAAPAVESAAASPDAYTVVKGDTLWGIAERFTGNPFNYRLLARINEIPDPNVIEVGQLIRLK